MPEELPKIVETAKEGLIIQEAELAATRQRQLVAVLTRTATGSGDISQTVGLDRKFRLVFVRCHFSGTPLTERFTVSVDSADGAAYDTRLFTITQAGTNRDVNLRIGQADQTEPSAWTFQAGDQIRIEWANPDSGNITWGLEVGLTLAS
jgi:hypothetical protein